MRGNPTIKRHEGRNGMISIGTKEWKLLTRETHIVGATENWNLSHLVCLSGGS